MGSRSGTDKWFEKRINAAGSAIKITQAVFWHRFPDSYAARGALPAMPGDFMMLTKQGALLIEAKTSEVHKSLKSCAANVIDPQQVGQHLLWHRSGHPSIFMFYSAETSEMEVWDGYVVARARSEGSTLPKNALLYHDQFLEADLFEFLMRYA